LKKAFAVFLTIVIAFLACTDKKPSNPYPNRPPETHLFLVIGDSLGVPDTTARPDTAASTLVLYWYGEDPDGEIIGYEWAWDDTVSTSVNIDSTWWRNDSAYTEPIDTPDSITIDTTTVGPWAFTEGVMDTFFVKIRETFNYFTFYIRAIDNDSAVDVTPSRMTFPIINSPPAVQLPMGLLNNYSSVHSQTLGYQSFSWTGSDPDGSETISGYELALADTSFHWDPDTTISDTIRFAGLDWSVNLDSLTVSYTFSGLEPGCYRMFLRSYDIAGAYSRVIYYPETTGVWEVIPKHGDVLYIDDNSYYTLNDTMYTHVLDSLDIDYTALSFVQRSFYYPHDFMLSISDFNILIYNAGSISHLSNTGPTLADFANDGGHLMFSGTYSSSDTITYSFMPIDTIYDTDIFRPFRFGQPDTLDYLSGYPLSLETTQAGFFSFSYGFAPAKPAGIDGTGYKVLYTIDATLGDPGSVGDTVAVRFPYDPDAEIQEPAKLVFFSFPVFDCNVNSGFSQMFTHILLNEFADE
jgi:hypothetical protein